MNPSISRICFSVDCQNFSGQYGKWKDSVLRSLENQNLDGDSFVAVLSQNLQLARLFQMDAGVAERYTVGQHTVEVLNTALKYQYFAKPIVEKVMRWEEFLLFLALHDIGKGLANESIMNNPIQFELFKDVELKNTSHILIDVMKELGIDQQVISISSSMLMYDAQGLYLRGLISKEEYLDNLIEMAHQANLDLGDFYSIFDLFHRIDAKSYPSLSVSIFERNDDEIVFQNEGQEKLGKLQADLEAIERGHEVFLKLKELCIAGKSCQEMQGLLVREGKALLLFLQKKHKEMLWGFGSPKDYKELLTVFRDLFFVMIKERKDKIALIEKYNQYLAHCLANEEKDVAYSRFLWCLFDDNPLGEVEKGYLACLESELMDFRKNYKCRHSHLAEDEFGELLKLTFIHGTNSSLLPNLMRTGMCLMPTGRLLQMGVVPLSGEMREGIRRDAVNHSQLSGTNVDGINLALSYATEKSQRQSVDKEIKFLQEKLIEPFKASLEFNDFHKAATFHYNLEKCSTIIFRLRTTAPKKYNEYQIAIRTAFTNLNNAWKNYESSDDYKSLMPVDKDPDETLGYQYPAGNHYYYDKFKEFNEKRNLLYSSITRDIQEIDGAEEAVELAYPMLFASSTIHAPALRLQNSTERAASKTAKIGKDITTIFANESDHLALFVDQVGLNGRVKIYELTPTIRLLIEKNRQYAPYFADIISRKRLNTLK